MARDGIITVDERKGTATCRALFLQIPYRRRTDHHWHLALELAAGGGIEMQLWRNHPVLFTASTGALIGLANAAILLLLVDPMRPLSERFLLCLFPTSILGFGFNGGSFAFSMFLAIVEVGGNALLYACTFAAPVALVIAIRRQFGRPEGPTSITGT